MVLVSFTCMKLIEIGNLIYLFYHFGKTRWFGGKYKKRQVSLGM